MKPLINMKKRGTQNKKPRQSEVFKLIFVLAFVAVYQP